MYIENNNYKQYKARVIHGTDRRNCVICLFRRVLSNMTIPVSPWNILHSLGDYLINREV